MEFQTSYMKMAGNLRFKKDVWLWAFYDFANSLGFINLSFYFTLWFVADKRAPETWISIAVALATILMLFTTPIFGRMSDRVRKRMPFLISFTLISILSYLFLGWIAIKSDFNHSTALIVITLYFLFNYFYQSSLTFYHSLIQNFTEKKSAESISGFGYGFGQLGNIIGLLLIFPIAQGSFSLFGAAGREATFLGAAILFLIFSLPVLFLLKDKKPLEETTSPSTHKSLKETWRDIRKIRQYPGVFPYLVAYYFFADAILTLQLFGTFYLEVVGGLNDKQKIIAGLVGLLFGVIGAFLSSKIAKAVGNTRKTIAAFILMWSVFIALLAVVNTITLFMIIAMLNGFAFGGLFALSRAYYSTIVPKDKQAEFFSIYVLFEKAASILGPLVWGLTVVLFSSYGALRYRFAMLSLAILVAISFIIFKFTKEQV